MSCSFIRHKHTIWIVAAVLCIALLATALWLLNGPSASNTKLDWVLHGTWITADGQPLDSFSFSLSGKIEKDPQGKDALHLNVELPENFSYSLPEKPTTFYNAAENEASVPYYICGGAYGLESGSDEPILVELALSQDQKFVILYFEDAPNCFLVGSIDPYAKSEDILTYFDLFVAEKTT
jgi:hypothetical protein